MTGVFLDTTVLLGNVLKRSKQAESLFRDTSLVKYTNEYALKEVYRVLKFQFKFSEIHIGYAIDFIRETCIVLPLPRKEEFKGLNIRDRSDRPIVYSAMKYDLVLCIDDEKTYQDAKQYVKVRRISSD